MSEHQYKCPQCGRYLAIDPDGYYDASEKDANTDTCHVAPFCDEKCACKFHGRSVPANYWKPAKAVQP